MIVGNGRYGFFLARMSLKLLGKQMGEPFDSPEIQRGD
jgi:hypothetical protein